MNAGTAPILPPLDPEQAAHAAHVLQALRASIAQHGGWLSFEDYMRLVLYAPGLGYYSAGSAKFGRAGDFITAPELSDLFGRALARQCAEVLARVGGDVLELGAGSGSLALTLLPLLQQLGTLPQRYEILEVSAELAARQRQCLSALPGPLRERVHWRASLPAEPMCGVLLANEVADALPVQRFVIGAAQICERGVALSGLGELQLADRVAGAALQEELRRIAGALPGAADMPRAGAPGAALAAAAPPFNVWPAGYESELCRVLDGWIGSLAAALARGAIFIIDYGLPRHEYYHPERLRGTLRCHFRHRAHEDALLYPGLQDISAWVDFTRVAEAASDARLEVAGYCTQAAFLLANGIEADVAAPGSPVQRARRAAQARQLLLPGEMGEYFKVMALSRQLAGPLRGFAYQDLRRLL